MSLFKRDPEPPPSSPRATDAHSSSEPVRSEAQTGRGTARSLTRIAEGTKVGGEISGVTELIIEGEMEGKLRVEARVVVGSNGLVRGEIEAGSVLIAGRVVGDVRGRERVEVGASGRLEGDISAPRVTIAEGAFFKGKVQMSGVGRAKSGRDEAGRRRAGTGGTAPSSSGADQKRSRSRGGDEPEGAPQ